MSKFTIDEMKEFVKANAGNQEDSQLRIGAKMLADLLEQQAKQIEIMKYLAGDTGYKLAQIGTMFGALIDHTGGRITPHAKKVAEEQFEELHDMATVLRVFLFPQTEGMKKAEAEETIASIPESIVPANFAESYHG